MICAVLRVYAKLEQLYRMDVSGPLLNLCGLLL